MGENSEQTLENGEPGIQSDTQDSADVAGEGNEQALENGESGTESDPQASTVEVIDYSEQLTIIANQQQVSIGVSCVLCGLLVISIVFNVLKRYIG